MTEKNRVKRAYIARALLIKHGFLYLKVAGNGNGSGRGKFRHPAIIAGVREIFFHRSINRYLSILRNSAWERMRD